MVNILNANLFMYYEVLLMDDHSMNRILGIIGFLVGVFIFLIGVFVIYFGISFMEYIDTIYSSYSGSSNPITWIGTIPWIINTIGIVVILYGLKRIITDILKL